jgi:hypothetical protein
LKEEKKKKAAKINKLLKKKKEYIKLGIMLLRGGKTVAVSGYWLNY